MLKRACFVLLALAATAGIKADDFTCFTVFQVDETDVGKVKFTLVINDDWNDVVLLAGDAKCFFEFLIEEVADDKRDGSPFYSAVQVVEGTFDIRALPHWLAMEEFANASEYMSRSFFGGNEFLNAVGKHNQTSFVIIFNG